MPLALAALLLAISLTSCSRPDGRLAERAHQLLNEGKLQQAQESLQDGFRQFPQSVALRQERLRLNLLAGQPELAAAEAHQILQTQPSAQPYRLPLRDPSPAIRSLAIRAFALDPPPRPSPSNVLTLLVPLMPNEAAAVAVLCLRYCISQMDVPTRMAYVQVRLSTRI